MIRPNQSRAIAAVAHHDDVARADPFRDPDADAVTIKLKGGTHVSTIEKMIPDGWHEGNLTVRDGRPAVQIFPD